MQRWFTIVLLATVAILIHGAANESKKSSVEVGNMPCSNFLDFVNGSKVRAVAVMNQQCYWAFEQGPCAPGEWIVFSKDSITVNKTRTGNCTTRSCPLNKPEDEVAAFPRLWIYLNETCYQTGYADPIYCENITSKVYLNEFSDVPYCSDSDPGKVDPDNEPTGRGIGAWIEYVFSRASLNKSEPIMLI